MGGFVTGVSGYTIDRRLGAHVGTRTHFFHTLDCLSLAAGFKGIPMVARILTCSTPGMGHSRMRAIHGFVLSRLTRVTRVLPSDCGNDCLCRAKHVAHTNTLTLHTHTTLCFNGCTRTRTSTKGVVSRKRRSLFHMSSLAATRRGRTSRVSTCVSCTTGNVSGSGFMGNVFDCRSL